MKHIPTLATAGLTLAVLAPLTTAQGSWAPAAKIVPPEGYGASNNHFGAAFAVCGDLAVVGSPGIDGEAGRAYVFERQGSAWVQQDWWVSTDPLDDFGRAVAVSAGTILIGAPDHQDRSGAVHIMDLEQGVWVHAHALGWGAPQPDSQLGAAVAVAGDTAFVGAPGIGAVHVLERAGPTWSYAGLLLSSRPAEDDFGAALAFDGARLFVGSPHDDAVHVFESTGCPRGRVRTRRPGSRPRSCSLRRATGTSARRCRSRGTRPSSARPTTMERARPTSIPTTGPAGSSRPSSPPPTLPSAASSGRPSRWATGWPSSARPYHKLPLNDAIRWRAKVVLGTCFGWAVKDTNAYKDFAAERARRRACGSTDGPAPPLPPLPLAARVPGWKWTGDACTLPREVGELRVAGILDPFTEASFGPECHLEQLRPADVVSQLAAFRPHVCLVESAWKGVEGLWQRKVSYCEPELVEVVRWCRDNEVPTVFWNKEDPLHFDSFIGTARLFDLVFTTDVDSIPRYREVLGHDGVYVLPFACQPRLHNPLEVYERQRRFCFAGSYYRTFPERERDLAVFARTLDELAGFDIYDRNHGQADPNYEFPGSCGASCAEGSPSRRSRAPTRATSSA